MDDDLRTAALAHLLFLETWSSVVVTGDLIGERCAVEGMIDEAFAIAPVVADEKDRREGLADEPRRRRAGGEG